MENKRKKIAIIFNFRKGWMGGVIYIINLVNALNFLEDDAQPEIIVFYNPDLEEFLKDFTYQRIQFVKWQFPSFAKGYFKSWVTGKNEFTDSIIRQYNPDGVYPMNDWPWSYKKSSARLSRVVAWFPDLQHKFYPHFFTRMQWWMREIRLRILLRHTGDLVVSSFDVKSHFDKLYTMRKDLRVKVLHFASIMKEQVSPRDTEAILVKYQITQPYFMVSNQFHNHKNHPLVIKALDLLKKEGIAPLVIFTGKIENPGNEEYVKEIKDLIHQGLLEQQVCMVGIIPRTDQVILMKNSLAVIQPSLFEGWSTVIEDSISLQVPVIAANLPVNIEQLGESGFYFDPHLPQQLANHMKQFLSQRPVVAYEQTEVRVKRFATAFMEIFNEA